MNPLSEIYSKKISATQTAAIVANGNTFFVGITETKKRKNKNRKYHKAPKKIKDAVIKDYSKTVMLIYWCFLKETIPPY